MIIVDSALQVIGASLKIAGSWIEQRGNPQNVQARVMTFEDGEMEKLHEAYRLKDINTIRKMLADRA